MSWYRLSIADGVALLILDRPETHNSMTADFWRELPAMVRDIDGNAKARVLVLTAKGKHFSSGIDLAMLAGLEGMAPPRLAETIACLQDSFTAIAEARIPVLAAIQGGCIGAGVDLIAACDCRYAAADAYFVIQEINLAMVADCGTFPRLTRLMPDGMVRELAFTGRRLGAGEALALGLVNAVLPDAGALISHVMELAREIAAKSPRAVAGAKRILNFGQDHTTAETLAEIARWQADNLDPTEVKEALAARGEKRAPRFAELPKRR
jgi:enoyl-CoA hydratase